MDKIVCTLAQVTADIVIEHVMPRHATAFLFTDMTSTPQLKKAELMMKSWEEGAIPNFS